MANQNSEAPRPLETAVMALLEQIIVEAEAAQSLVQDDSRVTGEDDRCGIVERLMRIRALTLEIERELGPAVRRQTTGR